MSDVTYCVRDCPKESCFCHKVHAPENKYYVWWADRWKMGICPNDAKLEVKDEEKIS